MKTLAYSILAALAATACVGPRADTRAPRPIGQRTSAQAPDHSGRWFSVGVQSIDPEPDGFNMTRELALHIGGGGELLRAEQSSVAWDAFVNYSVHTASTYDYSYSEEPANYALGGGLRATFDGLSPQLQPFVRGGLMWQHLVDYVLDDSGLGFYVGAGLRWRVANQFALSPQVTYTSSSLSDVDLEQFQIGVLLDFLL